ncbi:NAD(P)H-hydrate epimerase [Escherichia coli]
MNPWNARHWLVLCGHGNNGGDGYVVARLAKAVGIENDVVGPGERQTVAGRGRAGTRSNGPNAGGDIDASNIVWPESVDLIVDALLGTGLRQAPRESISQLIDHANSHPAPIVAVDIPSGLLAETGATPGAVINADHTITFIALKPGLLTGKARMLLVQLHFDSLGLDSWLAGQETQI